MRDQIKALAPIVKRGMENDTVQLGAILTNHQSIEGHLLTQEEHIAKAILDEGYRKTAPCTECRHLQKVCGRIVYGKCAATNLTFAAFGVDGLKAEEFSFSLNERRRA